jgi:hypothetical protein
VRQVEVAEDGADSPRVGEESEDAHVRYAIGASEGEDLVDAGEEAGPAGAGSVAGEGVGGVLLEVRAWLVPRSFARAILGFGRAALVAAEGDDPGPKPRIGGEDAMVAVAVDPGRRDQAREGFTSARPSPGTQTRTLGLRRVPAGFSGRTGAIIQAMKFL